MKISLLVILLIGILPLLPPGLSLCAVNDDWPEAPCLDTIGNGRYNQNDVNRWSEYYSYKGSIFMEEKYLELDEAIKEFRLQEWVDESMINRNVYEYYFFSGRAPNTGEYRGGFDVILVNEEGAPEYVKQTFVNLLPIRPNDFGFVNLILITAGISGTGIVGAIVIIKRRNQKVD